MDLHAVIMHYSAYVFKDIYPGDANPHTRLTGRTRVCARTSP